MIELKIQHFECGSCRSKLVRDWVQRQSMVVANKFAPTFRFESAITAGTTQNESFK
jgi:hypothetical protein